MKFKQILSAFAIVSVIAAACNISSNKGEGSVRELLMNENGWVLKSSFAETPDGVMTDVFNNLEDCDKDDIEYYRAEGVAVYDEGPLLCDSGAQQLFYDRWELLDDNKTLIIIFEGIDLRDTYNIISITEKELKMTSRDRIKGELYTYTDKYEVNK